MKRTTDIFVIFFIIGIIIGYYFYSIDVLIFSVFISIGSSIFIYRKYKHNSIFLIPLFVIIGFIRIITFCQPSDYNFEKAAIEKADIEVTATVLSIGKQYDDSYISYVVSESANIENTKINSAVKIKATFDNFNKFCVGDKIKIFGTLYRFDEEKNPGGFNEKLYYNTKNIEYKMYPQNAFKIGEANNVKILLQKINDKFSTVFDEIFPQNEASIIKAIIIGNKNDLSYDTKDLFSKAGIYHIIAISGLHIHILAFLILFITEKFHKRYGKLAAILFIVVYCVFTGANPATVRATLMFSIYIFGKFIFRESDVRNCAVLSAFCILLFNPLYLFDVGFQYSYCAVFSMIIFTKPISDFIKFIFTKLFNKKELRTENNFVEIISSAISVNFLTKIIVWYNFFAVPILDVFANLIILPFSAILVLFGFISGIVGLISLDIASVFASVSYVIIKFYEFVCDLIINIPFSYITLGKPDIFKIISYVLIVASLAMIFYKYINKKVFYSVMIFVTAINIASINYKEDFKIAMLDVGQGDCFVFNKNDKCFVIDGGGNFDKDFGRDTGVNVLFPYLKYMGVSYVDAVFITHTDIDHTKGILEIMDCVKIGKIFLSDIENNSPLYYDVCNKAYQYGIEIIKVSSGDKFNLLDDVDIECIYPFDNSDKSLNRAGNSASIVLKVSYKNNSFLFTGDIDEKTEKEIISSGKNITADVLKLSHHGSKYSNCEDFLNKVNPYAVIVSAGNFERYGHPSKEVIKKLYNKNIKVFNTYEKGAVEIYSNGEVIKFKVTSHN